MAGHSKWANTKHRKSTQDAKRGKIFTKIIRELITAARLGSNDPSTNPRLRAVMDKALLNNMTRDTMTRAIARGIGCENNRNTKDIIYEGYGPGGTAVIVECLSENRNRTVSEIRHAFSKCGGNLSTNGSVSYLFTKKGVISCAPCLNEDAIIDIALESGADDIVTYSNGTIDVFTSWKNLGKIKDALNAAGLKEKATEVIMIPLTKIDVNEKAAQKLIYLIDMLKECDDVQKVYHNGLISDDIENSLQRGLGSVR